MNWCRSHAKAARYRNLLDPGALHGKPGPLGHRYGFLYGVIGKDCCKLLAAIPEDQALALDDPRKTVGCVSEHRVTKGVAMRVVDGLEMIDICEYQADRLIRCCPTALFAQHPVKRSPAQQLRQVVAGVLGFGGVPCRSGRGRCSILTQEVGRGL